MVIVKKPDFKRTSFEKKQDSFTVYFNKQEREEFEAWKYLIQQEKDGTAIKQLARIGAKLLDDNKTKVILEVVLNNYRRNKNLGIVTFE